MCIAKCLIFLEVSVVDFFFSRAPSKKVFFFSVCLKFLAECSAGRQCGENKYKQLMKCTFSRNNDTVSRPRGLFSHLSWTFFRRGTNVCRVSWEHGSKIISSGRGFNELSSVTLSNAIYRFIMTAVGTYNVLTSFCELIRNLRLYFEDDGCFSGNFISPRIFLSSRKKVFINFHFAD